MAYSKTRKHRGRKDCNGHKKKGRGAGNRGGRGKAGLSKHKFTWVAKNDPTYFSKPSMKPKADKQKFMNLTQIENIILKKGLKELDLSEYKILGTGNITEVVKIKALSFSKKALEKIKQAGGKTEALYAGESDEKIEQASGDSPQPSGDEKKAEKPESEPKEEN